MTIIKVGDIATYVHRACSLKTSKISSIQIINCQNELKEVNEHDLDEKMVGFVSKTVLPAISTRLYPFWEDVIKKVKKQFSKSEGLPAL